ncbi:hypothetical protein ACHAW5_002115 [Stephanodiscus triporus]|uniref:Uncharacterized protein n=1 Tax=Stephanodiscus triporus TaxID=2934178 RepID=A0ABD3MQE7_9STRA
MSAHRPSFKSVFLKNYDGGVGSGILSPAPSSGCGSTTVTPITPMTPMTTPRTPLQILLGRPHGVGGPYRRSSMRHQLQSTLSDQEDDDQYREKQLVALQLFANFLNTAETTLNDITERENSGHQVLGPGIVRVCHDLADEIEGVASELNKEHARAARHLERVMSDHELKLIEEGELVDVEQNSSSDVMNSTNDAALALATLKNSDSGVAVQSHEEFMTTLSTTHTLLLDMAAALRAVTQQEAQELGEVALEVARMFLWSLGIVHSNMIQMTVSNDYNVQSITSLEGEKTGQEKVHSNQRTAAGATVKRHRVTWSQGPAVEILEEEAKKDDHGLNPAEGSPTKNTAEFPYAPQLSPIPSSPGALPSSSTSSIGVRHPGGERVRVLWPPLLPAAIEAGKLCSDNAQRHPIPAVVIGLTLGPAAIVTAAIAGPPLLVADWAVQTSYDALSEHTPVIENVEKGAASALQVARLAVLCSKLVAKQGMSVCERQIERRGGAGKICSDVVGGAVDMALHPIETAGMAWEGLFWIGGAVKDVVEFVQHAVSGGELSMDTL